MARQKRAGLLDPIQEKILAVLLLRPQNEWYRSELARHLGTSASSLQRPLAALVSLGVLRARQDGNRVYYRPDPQNPLYPEIRGLLEKTSGLVDVLREALENLAPKITVAFVHGSVAANEESSSSDVDLLVVGQAPPSQVAAALRAASLRLGREVTTSVYSDAEFAAKVRGKNRFLRSVLDKPKLFVVGTAHDLPGASGTETGRAGAG